MQTLVVTEMNWLQSKFCKSLFHLAISSWIHFPTFSRPLQNLISKSIQNYINVVEDGFRSWPRAQTIIVKLKANELLQIQEITGFLLLASKYPLKILLFFEISFSFLLWRSFAVMRYSISNGLTFSRLPFCELRIWWVFGQIMLMKIILLFSTAIMSLNNKCSILTSNMIIK